MTDIGRAIEEAKAAALPFESWERLPGESGAAYAAFCVYRDFGSERNIRKAAEGQVRKGDVSAELPAGAKGPRSGLEALAARKYRAWRNWAAQYRWRERAAEYDRYTEKLRQAELRKTIEAQGEMHRAVTGKMLAVVSKKLDLMDPADLAAGTVTEWVETAIKAERDAAGLAAPNGGKPEMKQGEISFSPEFEGI
jgi:hypothetical protein